MYRLTGTSKPPLTPWEDWTVKIKRAKVVELFTALEFKTADKWTNERLMGKLEKLGSVIDDETTLSDEHKETLHAILKAQKKKEPVNIIDDAAPAAAPAKAGKAAATAPKVAPPKVKAATVPEPDEDDDEPAAALDEDDEDDAAPPPKQKAPKAATPPPAADDDEDDDEPPPPKKPGKKASAPPPEDEPGDPAEDTQDEEAELEEEAEAAEGEETPTPKKKKGGAPKGTRPVKAGGEGPGVIASILEFLLKATEDRPITKQRLVEKLVKRFPQRDPEGMSKTVSVQIPNRIKREKGVDVRQNENGYWIAQ
jgi:hypothetical protein